jgi:hypothetical protein
VRRDDVPETDLTGAELRRANARDRILSKLPIAAADLTPPQRAMLKDMERAGEIVYREEDGRWYLSL